jgi:N-acetylmuramoyl-L-alanine amidase
LQDRRNRSADLEYLEWSRRQWLASISALCAWDAFSSVAAKKKAPDPLNIKDYLSPLNSKRPSRPKTEYIILHTTEGEEKGSLSKIHRYGEAHFFVSRSGQIYRVVDRSRIATHAGRSMWDGHSTIDNYSIGIEIAGYHDQDITTAQYSALRSLLAHLKHNYRISDDHVLTHSMVAYGRPNRFHPNNHRGRKRCGMIFADPGVRSRLGLSSKPDIDPDVENGALKIGDDELYVFLFKKSPRAVPIPPPETVEKAEARPPIAMPRESTVIGDEWSAWRIARERYNSPDTVYVFPNGNRFKGNEIREWSKIPKGTQVILSESDESQGFEGFLEIGKDGNTAQDLAGTDYDKSTSIYFLPDGMIRTGGEMKRRRHLRIILNKPPAGTRVLVGYVYAGHVKTRRRPARIAGIKWNYPSTYYRFPDGSIVGGDQVGDTAIPAGTLVFYQQ